MTGDSARGSFRHDNLDAFYPPTPRQLFTESLKDLNMVHTDLAWCQVMLGRGWRPFGSPLTSEAETVRGGLVSTIALMLDTIAAMTRQIATVLESVPYDFFPKRFFVPQASDIPWFPTPCSTADMVCRSEKLVFKIPSRREIFTDCLGSLLNVKGYLEFLKSRLLQRPVNGELSQAAADARDNLYRTLDGDKELVAWMFGELNHAITSLPRDEHTYSSYWDWSDSRDAWRRPALALCIRCGRGTWAVQDIGKPDELLNSQGARCGGIFEKPLRFIKPEPAPTHIAEESTNTADGQARLPFH